MITFGETPSVPSFFTAGVTLSVVAVPPRDTTTSIDSPSFESVPAFDRSRKPFFTSLPPTCFRTSPGLNPAVSQIDCAGTSAKVSP